MIRCGLCSATIISPTFAQYVSQSGLAMDNVPVKLGLDSIVSSPVTALDEKYALLHPQRFKHQDSLPHIPSCLHRNLLERFLWRWWYSRQRTHPFEYFADVFCAWRRNTHEQATGPDRCNESRGAVRAENKPHVCCIFLHRSAQCGLGVTGKRVGFVDDDDCRTRRGLAPYSERRET